MGLANVHCDLERDTIQVAHMQRRAKAFNLSQSAAIPELGES